MENSIVFWNKFRDMFIDCTHSNVEKPKSQPNSEEFWGILWRLKDEAVRLQKTAKLLNQISTECYLIDSFKVSLVLQTSFLKKFFEGDPFESYFDNFQRLIHSNETYVRFILTKNQLDSSYIWIIKHGDEIFPELDSKLKKNKKIWDTLKNPQSFRSFSEEKAKNLIGDNYNYFGVIEEFARGLEGYVDRLREGSIRNGSNIPGKANLQTIIDATKQFSQNNVLETDIFQDKDTALSTIFQICNQFHKSARILNQHKDEANRFEIQNEHDVQQLFFSFLILYFEDIRREEPSPSFAGKSSRIDFLLKQEQIGIEVKYATEKHNERNIGDELKIDIIDYKKIPNCNTLICFIYDPKGIIINSKGLKNDLESLGSDEFKIITVIKPQD